MMYALMFTYFQRPGPPNFSAPVHLISSEEPAHLISSEERPLLGMFWVRAW